MLSLLHDAQRMTIWPVRDCGRFPVKLHEKLKRATNLRILLKPLLAILCVVRWFYSLSIISLSICDFNLSDITLQISVILFGSPDFGLSTP
jgi:hypothetical protein